LAIAANAVIKADGVWYILTVIGLTRFLESIPFWRFHDRVLAFSNPAPVAVAAKASDS